MMDILGTIAIGFIAGLLARALLPGRDPGGLVVTVLLGIGGALVAKWAGQLFGWYKGDDAASFVSAVIGSVAILLVFRLIRRVA
jgi:uncharacterized membrane protein YeaQ/YmgE (transglycosylase-associated protein family)